MLTIVIPARQTGRYGRFPGKATAMIDDRSLVEIAVDCAVYAINLLDIDARIVVSTDDSTICRTCEPYSSIRPSWLLDPSSPAIATVAHYAKDGHGVQLNATSPLRSPEIVARCIDAVMRRPSIDYVATVKPLALMRWPDPDPWCRPRTQDVDRTLVETGDVFVYGPSVMAGNRPREIHNVVMVSTGIDIDTEVDLLHAMALVEAGLADLPPKREV